MLTFWLELSTLYFSIAISTNIYTHLYIYTHIHISTIALHLQQPIYSKILNKRLSPPPPPPPPPSPTYFVGKKHVRIKPKQGFLAAAVRQFMVI